MRAVVCRECGNDAAVGIETLPEPVVDEHGVRIAIASIGVSFANLLVLAGKHQNTPPVPFTPGTEVSGIVIECGAKVSRFRPGDRVAASVRNGGFAEQVVAPERTVHALPEAIDFDAAVQFPTIYATAYAALVWRARVRPGETVLVHGAAGGSGLAAIEIAKCLGARVIASVSGALKAEACRRHGADVVIKHREQSIRERVLALTDGRGAEVIFDPVGGEAFDESLRCIAPEGRLITMGFASGTIPRVPANILLVKNFDVIGLYWGYYLGWSKQAAHPREEARVRAAMAELFAWCEQGRLNPETLARYRLDDWRAALDVLAAREVIGRVVINPVAPMPLGELDRESAKTVTHASAPANVARPDSASLVMEEFMVPGADPGVQLYVRNKRLASLHTFSQDNVVLFVHGATYPAETGFDLQLDGISWMDVLAAQGFDVYMVDIRGYGKSSRPAEMDQPASANKPIVNSDVAARDYAAAADWIRARRGVAKLNAIGHSWGTVITALYATRHDDKVNRLVLFAPVWIRRGGSLVDSGEAVLGAYREVTIEAAKQRKATGLKQGIKPQPDTWFDAWAEATFASDPLGSRADPKYVRAPNGVVEDGRLYWGAGKAIYDPALIRVPTLLILAEWDADTPPDMAQTLFPLLVNASPKKLVILSEGTHGVMNEMQRFAMFDEVERFLTASHKH